MIVSGAGGFIGRRVPPLLAARGFEVHALERQHLDLLDPDATDNVVSEIGATHLLHLAWYTKHGAYWDAPENLDWAAATLRLARSFREAGGERLVAAGTCAEYDWKDECCSTRTPLRPATLYGTAKDATRRVLQAYAGSSGLSFAWGRVFFPYGPGEQASRVVAAAARAAVTGETVACSSGNQVRDFLYVDDVAAAFVELVDSDAAGCFDIGSGEGIPLRAVLLKLEELAGRQGFVRFGEAPERDEPASIVADPGRLRAATGWQPSYGLQEGLERTLTWWREATLAPRS